MKQLVLIAIAMLLLTNIWSQTNSTSILQKLTDAWEGQKSLVIPIEQKTVVAFEIKHKDKTAHYFVTLLPEGKATLSEGTDTSYLLKYMTDQETLEKLATGKLTSMTAMAKARESDAAPMEVDFNPALEVNEKMMKFFFNFSMYFWNQDWPAKFLYGKEYARNVHGGIMSVFAYNPGLRSGWFRLEKGMHANQDEDSKTNPFPSLFIMTKGIGKAKFGNKIITVKEGETYLIPAGMVHEFWVEGDQVLEGVLIMFGEGA